MFRTISIQKRLLAAFGALAFMLAALGLYNLNTMSQIRERANLVETNTLPSLMSLADLNLNVTRLRALTLRLMLTTDITQEGATLNEVEQLRAEVRRNEQAFSANIYLDEEREVFADFEKRLQQYLQLQQEALEFLKQDETGMALDLLQQINPITAQMTTDLLDLTRINQQAANTARTESVSAYQAARIIVIVLIVLAVAVAIVIALVISRGINQPLEQAVASARQIAEGDLTQRINKDGDDELTRLAEALQQMQQKLRDAIGHIASSASQLASAAEELNAVTDESARAIQQQNDEVQQAATAITEMSSAVDEVAATAMQTSDASAQSANLAKDGSQKVTQTRAVIGKMNTEVQQSVTVINVLAEKVSSINQVLEVIRSVAEQTNLLALNAAIEAARAGDAGRGFAVVADEVRSLAHRTQTSTGEIEQMIQQVQGSVREAVNAMGLISQNAGDAQNVAEEAAAALGQIATNITSISDQNHVIASAAEEQSKVAREIDRNIITISDLANQTSAGSQQTSASATELSRLAIQLNELVNRFKV
ncbi:methyl-accepting chemotaxis protein [Alishewanella jeotgali]|uniref:Methyl-accepting chemotaxis sensory transducer n=1 Tax=Alishewanella jeotgali KCTC 22429 TaxID=1129374 RepID=H3ZDR6_9ALTE|nr:methyl-accepting chemotaxis protein [Alishewanella jeotgali]EHR41297.1 methyl-accepting chemotaxis sensory transducer [Alishewanella jeotgali KCTC 22429]